MSDWNEYVRRFYSLSPQEQQAHWEALTPEQKVQFEAARTMKTTEGAQFQGRKGSSLPKLVAVGCAVLTGIGLVGFVGLAIIAALSDDPVTKLAPPAPPAGQAPAPPAEPAPSSTAVQNQKEWYSGGTLHGAKMSVWSRAAYGDRLATTSDFVAKLIQIDGMTIPPVDELKPMARGLEKCISGANAGGVAESQEVASIAATCWVLMKG